jgi:hypothetical protein
MSGYEQATTARAQIFDKFALILRKGDPRDIRFYGRKTGGQDRMEDGAIIRKRANDYELIYAPGLNLGRLHASLDVDGQRDLISMAGHQMRGEMHFCQYTPQIFLFLAKYYDFSKALETVLAYLKMDETGWYTMLAVSDFIAHDHPLITDAGLEAETRKLIEKLGDLKNDTYEKWRVLPHEGGRGPKYVAYQRTRNAAHKVIEQMMEIRHMRLEKSLEDSPVLRTVVVGPFKTGDSALDEFLRVAQGKFLSGDPDLRKEALEKLWDAWERLKTLETGKDKKDSVRILLDKTAHDSAFRQTLRTEAQELSDIGNSYMIRHTEVGKTELASPEQVEYFFHRMFSLIRLILRATGRS